MTRHNANAASAADEIICGIALNLFANLFDFFTLWYKRSYCIAPITP
jgi:hypothetical protein